MSDEPPPPPVESPCTAFLERAAPIIARERGLTPRARLLLESLAKDMALSSDDYQQAMAILQRGELLAAKATDPQRSRFHELLKRQLGELSAGILSARHEQTLVSFAVTQLAMADDAARDDVRQVAAELGLRRVPLEEALRYVEEIVAQKIGDENRADPADVRRLYVLARDWGLEPADIDELVRFRVDENAARRRRENLWNTGVVAGAVGAVGIVLVVLIVIGLQSYLGTGTTQPTKTRDDTASPPTTSRRMRPPSWWDTDLTIAVSQVRSDRDDFGPIYDALIAEEPDRRAQGYELLVDRAAAAPFDLGAWKLLEPVIIGCYALEPDESAAATLRKSWLKVPEAVTDAAPTGADGYQAAIRPVASAVRAIKDKRTPQSRQQALADDLGRLLRTRLDPESPEGDLQRGSLAALAALLLDQLAEEVEKRPAVLGRHYATLAALARDRVPYEEQARLDAAIAAAAVEHTPDTWRSWDSILNRGIEARDPLSVLRIVDAFDRCRNAELRKVLAPRLFARAGASAAGLPTDQYAAALRKALGASLPVDTSDEGRWSRLEQRAAIALQQSPSADDNAAALRSTAELAWHVNLAMSLAIARPNPGQFDRWLAEGPPGERASEESDAAELPTAPPPSERMTRDQQETFDRYIHDLGDWQKLDEARRSSYLRGIAAVADRVSDVTPIQARQIAAYLLGRKRDEEQAQVMDAAASLRAWKQLRISLADGIERAQLEPAQLRRLVLVFTGREVADIDKNRAAARRILLQSVVQELTADRRGDAGAAASNLDRWACELSNVYRERARLLGMGPIELDAAQSASALLRLSVLRLEPAKRDAAAVETDSRLITLADALGQSDAQRTVLLQRAMIDRTLQELTRRLPQKRGEANKIADELEHSGAAATGVASQLRDGEATLLRLWMLMRPK